MNKAAQKEFQILSSLGERLEKTSGRLEMTGMISQFLQGLSPEEVPPGVRLLVGNVFPEWDERSLGLSWRAVSRVISDLVGAGDQDWREVFGEAVDAGEAVRLLLDRLGWQPTKTSPLTILEVYRTFEAIAEEKGRGSRGRKEKLLKSILSRTAPLEAKFLVKNILGEMRHGASEGILLDSIARASGTKKTLVRRANMFLGDLGEVARLAVEEGKTGLEGVRPLLFRPLKPMLAQPVQDLAEAFAQHDAQIGLEYKLDGARVQLHRKGPTVKIYTRNLSQVTSSLPEIVEEVRYHTRTERAILEGEVIAVDGEGRPLPFQHLMRRFRRVHKVEEVAQQVPVQLFLFDILYRDEEVLVDRPYDERWGILQVAKGDLAAVPRTIPPSLADAESFAQQAYRDGHEGVMAKHLSSPYRPGVRGKSWLKIKHTLSLDLVIVAADWGYGRRHGWLSNYHLAVRDQETGSFLEVGKTFKGLTDDEFESMTQTLLGLETHREGGTVFVEPRVVVEVVFNEIQASPQYESGLALRFARISHLRDDKRAAAADTLQTLRTLFERQFAQKGRPKGTGSA